MVSTRQQQETLYIRAVAPPEIFHRGGQMGPVKILGWHTKTTV